MNDLTFGATLLSCFAMLIVSVIIEITPVPQRTGAPVAHAGLATGPAVKDCTAVALAPAATGH